MIGGSNIHALGYEYILTPITFNTVTILLVALFFNALFRWRRYPSFFIPKASGIDSAHKTFVPVDHASFVYALSQMDTFIDVTEDDLLKIYQLATGRGVNGELHITRVNSFLNPNPPQEDVEIELALSTEEEKTMQIRDLEKFHQFHEAEQNVMMQRLSDAALDNSNLFEVLMDASQVFSLGQITQHLYQLGGKYRRNM